jgi:hypothetical protein
MNEKNLKTYLTETLPNEKEQLTSDIIATLETEQYRIAEVNVYKPWG